MLLQGQQLGWSAEILRDVAAYLRQELTLSGFRTVRGKTPTEALIQIAELLESGQPDQPRPDC